jgi:hypothetical protein
MPSPTTTIQRRDLAETVSEYALEQSRSTFAGLRMMPLFDTALQTGNYPIIAVEQMLKPRDVKRASRGGYNRGDWGFEQGNYACVEYGWEEVVDDSLAKNYRSYFDAETIAARIATDVLLREQEKRIKTLAEASTAHAASVKWSTAATATPRSNVTTGIKTIVQATGLLPNIFVCTWQTFQNLINTTEVVEATKYGGSQLNTRGFEAQKAAIATYFGVNEVVVTNAVENGNKEGAAFSATQIWSDANGFLVVAAGGSIEGAPSWGRSFLWRDDSPSNVNVESYREDAVRGTIIRTRHYVDEKELNAHCIYMLSNLA